MLQVLRSLVFVCTVVATSSVVAEEPSPVVVETWNIRYDNSGDGVHAWPRRADGVVAHLKDGGLDVIGLQEVLPHQLVAIKTGLPEYEVFARSRERDKSRGEAVPILWRRDRWRLDEANSTHFWLSETPEVPGSMSWNTACTRMVTMVRLVPVKSGSTRSPIWVCNLHLDHRSAEARLEGARLIRKRLAAMTAAHPDEPVIVLGDFNTAPDSPPIAALRAPGDDGAFVDAWASVTDRAADAPEGTPMGTPIGTWNGWDADARGGRIDLVLVRGLAVEAADILRPTHDAGPLSDHWPVRAVLILEPPRP